MKRGVRLVLWGRGWGDVAQVGESSSLGQNRGVVGLRMESGFEATWKGMVEK